MISLIDFLNLPPNQSSINLLKSIKTIDSGQYKYTYLFVNNKYLLISSYNYLKTLSNPLITHLIYFDNLNQLKSFFTNL